MNRIKCKQKICFIGLGTMGGRIVQNIKQCYSNIAVYDSATSKRKEFIELVYNFQKSASLSAKKADIVLTILPTSSIVRKGIFDTDLEGNSIIDSVNKNCLFIELRFFSYKFFSFYMVIVTD